MRNYEQDIMDMNKRIREDFNKTPYGKHIQRIKEFNQSSQYDHLSDDEFDIKLNEFARNSRNIYIRESQR